MSKNSEHAAAVRTFVAVLTSVCALAALIYVGIQTNISNKAMSAQAWQGINQDLASLNRIFIDYPDLRPYFYDHKPIVKDDANYNRVMAVAEAYLDFIEEFTDDYIRSQNGMEEHGEYWKIWEKYFSDMFASSPAICIRSREIQPWYSTDFTKYARTNCVEKKLNFNTSNNALQ